MRDTDLNFPVESYSAGEVPSHIEDLQAYIKEGQVSVLKRKVYAGRHVFWEALDRSMVSRPVKGVFVGRGGAGVGVVSVLHRSAAPTHQTLSKSEASFDKTEAFGALDISQTCRLSSCILLSINIDCSHASPHTAHRLRYGLSSAVLQGQCCTCV